MVRKINVRWTSNSKTIWLKDFTINERGWTIFRAENSNSNLSRKHKTDTPTSAIFLFFAMIYLQHISVIRMVCCNKLNTELLLVYCFIQINLTKRSEWLTSTSHHLKNIDKDNIFFDRSFALHIQSKYLSNFVARCNQTAAAAMCILESVCETKLGNFHYYCDFGATFSSFSYIKLWWSTAFNEILFCGSFFNCFQFFK